MRFPNSTSPIGLDFADDGVYLAQMSRSVGGYFPAAIAEHPVDALSEAFHSSGDRLSADLREVVKLGGFHGKRAVAHLPTELIDVIPVEFRAADPGEVEEAILRETQLRLTVPLDQAVVDYPSLHSLPDGTYRAMVVATRREETQRFIALFRQAGLFLEAIEIQMNSLIRLHRHLAGISSEPVILCNIGSRRTLLVIVSGDSILAQREVRWGTIPMAEKIADNLSLTQNREAAVDLLAGFGLAFESIMESGSGPDKGSRNRNGLQGRLLRALYRLLCPYVEQLVNELHQLIGYVRSETEYTVFDGLHLYGQCRCVRGLDHFLGKRIGVSTRYMDVSNMFQTPARSAGDVRMMAGYSLALGLAMRTQKWL
jgi:type IV pilus assembly protein PilM